VSSSEDQATPVQPTVLTIAYRCMPGRGTEYGAGWGVVHALQQFSDCTVITEPGSGAALEEWAAANASTTLHVEMIDDPGWAGLMRFHRIGEFLIYLAWQRKARRRAKDLLLHRSFDVAYHATLAAYWLPSAAVGLGIPSVWGPVGGAVTAPKSLRPLLGRRGRINEVLDWFSVQVMAALPMTRRTWQEATLRIAQNDATVGRLPAALRKETVVFNHALLHDVKSWARTSQAEGDPYVAWVSPMESRKGPELAVRALALTPLPIRMVMAGDGPERARIEGIADTLGVAERITFVGRVPHNDALQIIAHARVALFTGLREEGGLALTEAMLLGTPLVVLGNGGARAIAATTTDPDRVAIVRPTDLDGTISDFAEALTRLADTDRFDSPHERTPLIDQDAAVDVLAGLVAEAAGRV
jgi:glycosyltransferase involved in cell wall biosynthesis